ncbi:MAG: hypothetical protein OXU20_01865 [Myxococcales bacterium]|nr:hypothetical protein [Myxococcales bacterium]
MTPIIPRPQATIQYISSELVTKLRDQQREVRSALLGLERRIDLASGVHLLDPYRSLSRAYRAHDGLVSALLEAVEPDAPGRESEFE